jgi:hypothetical protein
MRQWTTLSFFVALTTVRAFLITSFSHHRPKLLVVTLRAKKPGARASGGFGAAPKAVVAPKFDGKATIEKHMKAYSALRAGPSGYNEYCCDVYVNAEGSEKFWFVGKSVLGESLACEPMLSAGIQKRIIFEHAKLLQKEVRVAKALTLWAAPANTEVAVAQHQQALTKVPAVNDEALVAAALAGPLVGFEPEQYLRGNLGFYVKLQPDGTAPAGSTVAAQIVSPRELEKLSAAGRLSADVQMVKVQDADDELKKLHPKPRAAIPTKGNTGVTR